MNRILTRIGVELRAHAPFTLLGTLTGVGILLVFLCVRMPASVSHSLFVVCHPLHVLFSAVVTTAMYRLRGKGSIPAAIVIGYVGSIGIATLSDCLIPYVGEWLVNAPNRSAHIGFIEEWWLVNPLAGVGIAIALVRPRTKLPHAGHVLLSTYASLFHMTMGLGEAFDLVTILLVSLFLFLAVWVPCCTSDIVFPLLFAGGGPTEAHSGCSAHRSGPPGPCCSY